MAGTGSFMGTFNVGTDLSIAITNNSNGASVTLDGRLVRFHVDEKDDMIESTPIDYGGLVDHRVLPHGLTGEIEVDRNSDPFSALIAFLDAQFYAGGPQTFFTITTVERYANGSGQGEYLHTMVAFHAYKPGMWQRERTPVKASIQFECQQRLKVA